MARLPIPFVGQAYRHRYLDISAQTCKNWFVEVNKDSQATASLQPWPGLKSFSSGSGANDRGMTHHAGLVYEITDQTLSSVNSSGTRVSIGTIAGTEKAYFASNGSTLIIVSGGRVYSWSSGSLTEETDSDFESPNYVTYINNQALYDGAGSRFVVSNAGDLAIIDGLNYASAEVVGDDIVRPYAFFSNEQVLMFCTKHIETWWNSGAGSPPFDRVQGGSYPIGLGAADSVAHNENAVYFVGDDSNIYRIAGSLLEKVSTIPISQSIASYSNISTACGYCLAIDGQNFYIVKFAETAWGYSEANNTWFELTSDFDEKPYQATSHVYAFGKNLMKIAGNIYELDPDTYTNDGETMVRERVSSVMSAKQIGPENEGREMFMNELEVVLRANADVTGEGSNPTFLLATSDDNGRTWIQREVTAAPAGNYLWRFKVYQLGNFYERVVRLICTDPIGWSVQSAIADVEVGI